MVLSDGSSAAPPLPAAMQRVENFAKLGMNTVNVDGARRKQFSAVPVSKDGVTLKDGTNSIQGLEVKRPDLPTYIPNPSMFSNNSIANLPLATEQGHDVESNQSSGHNCQRNEHTANARGEWSSLYHSLEAALPLTPDPTPYHRTIALPVEPIPQQPQATTPNQVPPKCNEAISAMTTTAEKVGGSFGFVPNPLYLPSHAIPSSLPSTVSSGITRTATQPSTSSPLTSPGNVPNNAPAYTASLLADSPYLSSSPTFPLSDIISFMDTPLSMTYDDFEMEDTPFMEYLTTPQLVDSDEFEIVSPSRHPMSPQSSTLHNALFADMESYVSFNKDTPEGDASNALQLSFGPPSTPSSSAGEVFMRTPVTPITPLSPNQDGALLHRFSSPNSWKVEPDIESRVPFDSTFRQRGGAQDDSPGVNKNSTRTSPFIRHPQHNSLSSPHPSPSTALTPLAPMCQPPNSAVATLTAVPSSSAGAKSADDSATKAERHTGTRKNITPSNMIPLDAPTQVRNYWGPSATSPRDLVPAPSASQFYPPASSHPSLGMASPSLFNQPGHSRGAKRARIESTAADINAYDDELPLDVGEGKLPASATVRLPPNPTSSLTPGQQRALDERRRKNTLAARKSRKRKLEHTLQLETTIDHLTRENQKWRTRAIMLKGILKAHGIDIVTDWGDDAMPAQMPPQTQTQPAAS